MDLSNSPRQRSRFYTESKAVNYLIQAANWAIVTSIQVFTIIIVLYIDEGKSCDQPLDLWLQVWGIADIVFITLFTLYQYQFFSDSIQNIILKFICFPILLFMFAWFIIGNVWEFQSDTCYDEFYSAWVMTLIILIISYAVYGLSFCIVICVFACVKGAEIGASNAQELNAGLLQQDFEALRNEMLKKQREEAANK